MPKNQAYYLTMTAKDSDCARTDLPLVPNCAGLAVLTERFSTCNPTGRHDFYLQYLRRGEMEVWLPDGRRLMHPGEAILYYPDTPYHYAWHGEEIHYYWVHFTGSEASRLVQACGLTNASVLQPGLQDTLVADFGHLFCELMLRDRCFAAAAGAVLAALCTGISRHAGRAHAAQPDADSRISDALAYLHRSYALPLTVQELAAQAHLSPGRFRTLFRARTGMSPAAYLLALRMNHARSLLAQTDLTVREIAESVGFPDQLYFSRQFRRYTGLTPSACRPRRG